MAIVVGALIIAGAIIYVWGPASGGGTDSVSSDEARREAMLEELLPIDELDHVRGSADASVVFYEYSDLECPFCASFHQPLLMAKEQYGDDFTWVYRHFPLATLHSKARDEANASECAGKLGGEGAFWGFIDRFFELTPSNDQTDTESVYRHITGELGLSYDELAHCIEDKEFDEKVERDLNNAIETGGEGTPWGILVSKDGQKIPVGGALPYESLARLIESLLKR